MRALLVLLALGTSSTAFAETPLPVVDVDALCAKMAPNVDWCVHDEQGHYNGLKDYEWDVLSENSRRVCLKAVGAARPRYYFLLDGCVIRFLAAEEVTQPPHDAFKP